MAVTITASLVDAGDPRPVQIILTGVPAGSHYTVTGTAGDSSWPVPGGVGVSEGEQIVLVDNRSALNVAVVYTALVDGVTYETYPVYVVAQGKYVLQSLDGRRSVQFVLQANGLPRDVVVRSQTFDVPGRPRPPGRYAEGGDGGGALALRTSREDSAEMHALVRAGRPVVLRTDGTVRDFPAVTLLVLMEASSQMWDAVDALTGEMSTERVWDLGYVIVNDPEPGRVLAAFTWDDFDEAMTGLTWDDFDAMFAGSTWDDFDTTDWGQYL